MSLILFVEIGMFIAGIYAIVVAKVPSFLVGDGKYKVEGLVVRWLGVLLLLPLPIALLLFGPQGIISLVSASGLAVILELIMVFGDAILFVGLVRVLGKGTDEIKIRKTLLLLLGFVFLLLTLGTFLMAGVFIVFCDAGPISACTQSSFYALIAGVLGIVLSGLSFLAAIKLKHKNN